MTKYDFIIKDQLEKSVIEKSVNYRMTDQIVIFLIMLYGKYRKQQQNLRLYMMHQLNQEKRTIVKTIVYIYRTSVIA